MIKFSSVSLRNFLSYGNNTTVIELDKVGTTLIIGEDLDNTTNGQGANGVGKSSIINAIAYAVYDKPISNISKDNLVNNINKKNMEVAVNFTTPNGKQYTVKRTRKMKAGAAGNAVYVYEDGKDITPDSVSNANDLIVKIIGIPYELFVRIVVFSASHTPFLDLPATSHYAANQRDIIEELFGLTMLTSKAEMLKEIIKDTESRLATNQAKIEALEAERERYETQLESAKKRVLSWERQNDETIAELETKLAAVGDVDVEEQQKLHAALKEAKKSLQEALEKQRATETAIKSLKKQQKSLSDNLTHLRDDKCPYCLQGFSSNDKLEETENELMLVADQLSTLSSEAEAIEAQISTLSHTHNELKSKITFSNLEELLNTKNQSATIVAKIEELKNAINPYIEPLDELNNMAVEPVSYDEINKITKEVEHQKFLLKLLTKKDSFVRKALLNKNIPFLNQKLAGYLTILGLPHKVEFTHEMTASISQFGHELDFGNLSAGQRARVNLALSFAFRDVLQNMHTKVNVCMLDEALDHGLDTVGVQSAIKMLKRKARDEGLSMFVITHRDVDVSFDNTLTIQLSNGFSYIKSEEN
jgi:DNA repair exonuclease SbcCD ATPase subunit